VSSSGWNNKVPSLTIVLLGLLLVAPLSPGDRGLRLSLGSTAPHLVEIESKGLPAVADSVVRERAGGAARVVIAPGSQRAEVASGHGTVAADGSLGSAEHWTIPDAAPSHLHGEPFADHPAPRTPPA
jgi:hypothetical protein